jgi:hypothetical protein
MAGVEVGLFAVNIAVLVQVCILLAMLPQSFYTRALQVRVTLQTTAPEMLVRSFLGALMWAVPPWQEKGALNKHRWYAVAFGGLSSLTLLK